MKSNNRVIAAAIAASLLVPMFASAETMDGTRSQDKTGEMHALENGTMMPKAGDMFCTRIAAASGEHLRGLGSMTSGLAGKRQERDTRLDGKRKERDSRLDSIHASQDGLRSGMYAKLLEHAQTDAQKQAITTFKTAVEAAVAARRAAVGAADSAFNAGIEAAMAKRKTAIDAAVAAFSASVKAAEDKAKSDCAVSGADGAAIKTTLAASVKAAKDKLMSDRAAADKISDSAKPLVEAHRIAIDKAFSDFAAAVKAAKTAVKASWNLKENVK